MNGAVMDRRQDPVLRPQHRDNSGLHSPGYHLQINQSHQQNSRLQHSKAMHYQSLSDPFVVDGSCEYMQFKNSHRTDEKWVPHSENIWDPRSHTSHFQNREPLELPVPKFEIDENYVGEPFIPKESKCNAVENSKALDLDTRIDLLIKSKALVGMHPIFSELNDSEESSFDSDEYFISKSGPKDVQAKKQKPLLPESSIHSIESFDDPEKPLSRPPSPFLSRATYLFWFNKAIELKQQAKAQEQALLEKATKRLIHDSVSPIKFNETDNFNHGEKPLLKKLLQEVSKEFKKIAKQDFINEVLENAVFNTFDNWWEKQRQLELEHSLLVEHSITNLVPEDKEEKIVNSKHQSNFILKETSFKSDLTSSNESFSLTVPNEALDTKHKIHNTEKSVDDLENSTLTNDLLKKESNILNKFHPEKEKCIVSQNNSLSESSLYDIPLKKRNVIQVMELSCNFDNKNYSDSKSVLPDPEMSSNVNFKKIETGNNDCLRPSSELFSSESVNSFENKHDIDEDIYEIVKSVVCLLVNNVDRSNVGNTKTHTHEEYIALGNDTSNQTNSIITKDENESIKSPNFISNVNSSLENHETSFLPNQEALVTLTDGDSVIKTENQHCLQKEENITVQCIEEITSVFKSSYIEETVNVSDSEGGVC